MRALTPIARMRSRLQPLRVLNGEAKTVVRLVLEEPALVGDGGTRRALAPRLHVDRRARLRQGADRVTRHARGRAGFARRRRAAARRGGRRRRAACPAASRPSSTSRCGPTSAPTAPPPRCSCAWSGRSRQNLPGTLADIDSEFLHDLRVAVRRTRSLQRQLQARVPAGAARALPRRSSAGCSRSRARRATSTSTCSSSTSFRSALPRARRADLEPLRGAAAPSAGGASSGAWCARCARARLKRAARRLGGVPRGPRRARRGRAARRRDGRSASWPASGIAHGLPADGRRRARAIDDDEPARGAARPAQDRARSCATCSSSSPASIPAEVVQADGARRSRRCRTRSAASRTARCRPAMLRSLRRRGRPRRAAAPPR